MISALAKKVRTEEIDEHIFSEAVSNFENDVSDFEVICITGFRAGYKSGKYFKSKRVIMGIIAMIKSFKDKNTEKIFNSKRVKNLDEKLAKKVRRRLDFLNDAVDKEDMYFPPSNRFHSLDGFTPTRYAVRWTGSGA